jgi:cold shock CspA family protein
MLWFNEAKGYGFIASEAGERLHVDRASFVEGRAPVGRCAGRPVSFELALIGGKPSAFRVRLVDEQDCGRARHRYGQGRRFR